MDALKRQAAECAISYVRSGMKLGLGTGSTTALFIDLLGKRIASGQLTDIVGVPTSDRTTDQARRLGIPLISLSVLAAQRDKGTESGERLLDLAIDGADEVDPDLNLIKGLGRALLREKIIEIHAQKFLVIVDDSKLSPRLGTRVPLPVEMVPFEADLQIRWLEKLGCRAQKWLEPDGSPIITDNGNYLARCWFENGIADTAMLDRQLSERPGIVEHGLFLGMANDVIVAGERGIEILSR